jgi:undecaprenyl-diphosphatase
MNQAKASVIFERMDAAEVALCLRVNRACENRSIRNLFAVVSRLGNGVFWYTLILALPIVYGTAALPAAARMVAVGAIGLGIYKLLKSRMVRQRPFLTHEDIQLGTAPLDQYSFPSGHTLHAVAFTIVACAYYPVLAWVLVPFAAMVALSRVVLGLHYPTDVLAGSAIGALLATGTLFI